MNIYRRYKTYIPSSGVWVCTVKFPESIHEIFGITDIFNGKSNGEIIDGLPIETKEMLTNEDALKFHHNVINEVIHG